MLGSSERRTWLEHPVLDRVLWCVAIGLLTASVFMVYGAWHSGLTQSRTETASRLMAIRTSPLSTDTPGLNAWVSWSLLNSQSKSKPGESQKLRQVVHPTSFGSLPSQFQSIGQCLKTTELSGKLESDKSEKGLRMDEVDREGMEFRSVGSFQYAGSSFVFSQSKSVAEADSFFRIVADRLVQVEKKWKGVDRSSESGVSAIRSFQVARFYILNQDGTIVSVPIPNRSQQMSVQQVVRSERKEFRKNGLSPRLVSDNFFFRFRYDKKLGDQVVYSGAYLDLGGLGLVGTISRPIVLQGKKCVIAADVAFDVDWQQFADNLSPDIQSRVIRLTSENSGISVWDRILQSLDSSDDALQGVLEQVADLNRGSWDPGQSKSAYISSLPGGGDAMAIQVDRSTWLLMVLNVQSPSLPWLMMALTATAFGCLILHKEMAKQSAHRATSMAQQEMQEKQNLLDTMQIPLMVVDPNTDQLAFCNRAATSIGVEPGMLFGRDVVSSDTSAQKLYQVYQVAGKEPRRAYGIPVQLPGGDGYAVIRSVAVTAPIPSLSADSRHRLAMLFLLDNQADLQLLLEKEIQQAEHGQRQRLAGILSHGLDLFTRVLQRQMTNPNLEDDQARDLLQWITRVVNQRLRLTCWALDNWGKGGGATDCQETLVGGDSFQRFLDNCDRVFQIAASDRSLREQLHWNNGPFSNVSPGKAAKSCSFDWKICWSEEFFVRQRYPNVLDFILTELLINAARHGEPAGGVRVQVNLDPVRSELGVQVENRITEDWKDESLQSKSYGGLSIVRQLCELNGWQEVQMKKKGMQLLVQLVVPVLVSAKD